MSTHGQTTQLELTFGQAPHRSTDELTSEVTHFHLFDAEDIEAGDPIDRTNRLEVLAKLAAEKLPLTPEQADFLRDLMPREYGPPTSRDALAATWSLQTEGPHGERGVLRVRIAHDHAAGVELGFSPPRHGTWVDESSAFSQEQIVVDAPVRHPDPTGGKTIAARLLQKLSAG